MRRADAATTAMVAGRRTGFRSGARRVLLAGAGALVAAGCAQLPGTGFPSAGAPREAIPQETRSFALPVERPTLKVGDRWVWSAREYGERATRDVTVLERVVTSVAGDKIELRQVALHPRTRRPLGPVQMRTAKASVWHLEPGSRSKGEIQALAFPLRPGKEWEYEYWLGGGERDLVTTYRFRARVDGIETVRTPAGDFETLRVTHEGQWRRPVLEQGKAVERTGTVRNTYWYAPDVGTWVRLEADLHAPDGSRELGIVQQLVEYGAAP